MAGLYPAGAGRRPINGPDSHCHNLRPHPSRGVTPNGVDLPAAGGYVGGQTRRTPRRRPVRAAAPGPAGRRAPRRGWTAWNPSSGAPCGRRSPAPNCKGEEMISCPRNSHAGPSALEKQGSLLQQAVKLARVCPLLLRKEGIGRAPPAATHRNRGPAAIRVCRLVIYGVYYPATLGLSGRPAQSVS
jgi:hypothetical protein